MDKRGGSKLPKILSMWFVHAPDRKFAVSLARASGRLLHRKLPANFLSSYRTGLNLYKALPTKNIGINHYLKSKNFINCQTIEMILLNSYKWPNSNYFMGKFQFLSQTKMENIDTFSPSVLPPCFLKHKFIYSPV